MVGQSDLTGWYPKEQVIDPRGRPLKLSEPLHKPLEFGNQLGYNYHMEDLIG
jgi:hypothetical protein